MRQEQKERLAELKAIKDNYLKENPTSSWLGAFDKPTRDEYCKLINIEKDNRRTYTVTEVCDLLDKVRHNVKHAEAKEYIIHLKYQLQNA